MAGAKDWLVPLFAWSALIVWAVAVADSSVQTDKITRTGIVDERAFYVAGSGHAHPILAEDYLDYQGGWMRAMIKTIAETRNGGLLLAQPVLHVLGRRAAAAAVAAQRSRAHRLLPQSRHDQHECAVERAGARPGGLGLPAGRAHRPAHRRPHRARQEPAAGLGDRRCGRGGPTSVAALLSRRGLGRGGACGADLPGHPANCSTATAGRSPGRAGSRT